MPKTLPREARHRTLRVTLLLTLACAFASVVPARAGAPRADRQDLKAAFIYNLVKFTEWPEGALGPPGEPVVVGVLDDATVHAALRDLLAGKRAGERPLVVRRIDRPAEILSCHVLFVGSRTPAGVADALTFARPTPMLTIGNGAAFLDAGGMLGFEEEAGTLKFVASPDAAARARLTLNSQLLRVALPRHGS
jgi:hypothetical protein